MRLWIKIKDLIKIELSKKIENWWLRIVVWVWDPGNIVMCRITNKWMSLKNKCVYKITIEWTIELTSKWKGVAKWRQAR